MSFTPTVGSIQNNSPYPDNYYSCQPTGQPWPSLAAITPSAFPIEYRGPGKIVFVQNGIKVDMYVMDMNLEWTSAQTSGDFKSNGAVGDGVADDTTAVNAALTKGNPINDNGDFVVTQVTNSKGTPIVGNAAILVAKAMGKQQINTYADLYQRYAGREYLLPFLLKVLNGAPVTVLFRSDSSINGYYVTEANRIPNLFKKMCDNAGISVTCTNGGISGLSAEQWRTGYVSGDISSGPDLYYVEYGINDRAYSKTDATTPMANNLGQEAANRRTHVETINSIRGGMSAFRAGRTVVQSSIILATPNSTFNLNEGQDARYYEKLRNGYLQSARENKAAFFDNYAMRQDTTAGAASGWMENTFNDGVRTLHPLAIHNIQKASELFEFIFPFWFRQVISATSVPGYSNSGTYTRKLVDGVEQWVSDGTSPTPSLESLPFSTNNSTYDSGSNVYTAGNNTTNAGTYQNKELSTKKLNSQANGRIQMYFSGAVNADVILGYVDSAAVPGTYNDIKVGFFISSSGTIWIGTNGSFTDTGIAVQGNNFYGITAISRATTASFKLFRGSTSDFANPILVHTYDAAIVGTYTGNFYPVLMAENNKKTTNPKFVGLIDY